MRHTKASAVVIAALVQLGLLLGVAAAPAAVRDPVTAHAAVMKSPTAVVRAAGTIQRAARSCRRADVVGNSGTIYIQTSPAGTVIWGIYMHNPALNAGPWVVSVYVNNRRVDAKSQNYAPHGSVPRAHAPSGATFRIVATHVDPTGTTHRSVTNACIIP